MFKFIQKLTPNPDKLGHFYWGFIYVIVGIIFSIIFENELLVLIPCVPFALIKEIKDYYTPGNKAELMDFIYTVSPLSMYCLLKLFL